MCKAKPEPRCMYHATQVLNKAEAALNAALEEYDKVKNGRNTELKNALDAKLNEAYHVYHQAKRDYYASPKGIQKLEELMENTTDESERYFLKSQIDLARFDLETRKITAKLYKSLKESVPQKVLDLRSELYNKERQAFLNLAKYDRAPTHEELVAARKSAAEVSYNLRVIEELARRKMAGVKHLSRVPLSEKIVNSGKKAFVLVDSAKLGEFGSYVPFGGYAKITGVTKEANGTYSVCLEGVTTRVMTKQDQIFVCSDLNEDD